MDPLEKHILNIAEAVNDWLQPDNNILKNAIDETVNRGYFSFEDVKHRILSLKSTLKRSDLIEWARRSGLRLNSLKGKKILCLHAGNLPLVGIQDLLAVVMGGGIYRGKLSGKDPFLLPSFLIELKKYGLLEGANWSSNLNDLKEGHRSDAFLFAGSDNSVPAVETALSELGLISDHTPRLIRTAHFSVAYITEKRPETMRDLTEAVFRYGGAGCRSVAIVVAPFHLQSVICSFTDYVESFWLKNPQFVKPPFSLTYRYAYNQAMNIPQIWLEDFLIEESMDYPDEKFILKWVKGDFNTAEKLIKRFHSDIQSVYSDSAYTGVKTDMFTIEHLSQAQQPSIWWKPDQTDTIRWLQQKL